MTQVTCDIEQADVQEAAREISSASVGLATVQTNAGVAVQSVVPNVSAGTITIHLGKAPGKAVMVGWSVPN